MAKCDSDTCPHPALDIGNPRHTFSGYGFWCVYHPGCCPVSVDGSECLICGPVSAMSTTVKTKFAGGDMSTGTPQPPNAYADAWLAGTYPTGMGNSRHWIGVL